MARPGPILGRALRLPVRLYDIGAGRLLGHRFLLLTHRGRRSGRPYRTMRSLEVKEAAAALADYERRNRAAGPIVRAILSRLAGFPYDGSVLARDRLVEALPLVAFSPKGAGGGDS